MMISDEIHTLCYLSSKMDAVRFLSSKPLSSIIPGFVAYLIIENALNDLCG